MKFYGGSQKISDKMAEELGGELPVSPFQVLHTQSRPNNFFSVELRQIHRQNYF